MVENISINGSLPSYQLGDRHLMLPGTYEISGSLDGYHLLKETIVVGDAPEQTFDFTMLPLPGIVEITTSFAGQQIEAAEVFIDQELAGTTPITLDAVDAGIRDLYIRHPRFQPYETEIDVTGLRQFQAEQITLVPAWASVNISSLPSAATISIDGAEVGVTPGDIEVIEGIRTLTLKKPGYKSWETDLDVQAQVDLSLIHI